MDGSDLGIGLDSLRRQVHKGRTVIDKDNLCET